MPTETFNFDYYLTDYVAMFRKIMETSGQSIPPEVDAFLKDLERATDLRDTDLEDYLGVGSFSPSIGVSRVAVQGVADGTYVPLSFDTESWRSTEIFEWDGATKVTVQRSGIVSLTGNALFAPSATGARFVGIQVNGLGYVAQDWRATVGIVDMGCSISKLYPVVEGDYFELIVRQGSGGTLNTTGTFELAWLGQSG